VPAALATLVRRVVEQALEALVTMRATEGGILERDIRARLTTIAGFVDDLATQAREGQARLADRLRERLGQRKQKGGEPVGPPPG